MSLKKQHYIHKIALISSLLVFLSLNCNILTPTTPKKESIPPILVLSPNKQTSFNGSNLNKIVIQYDPKIITTPLNRHYSLNEGKDWIFMNAEVVGADNPLPGAEELQYYVLSWQPDQNLENPPPSGSKIWIKIAGYQNTSHINHIQKDITIE